MPHGGCDPATGVTPETKTGRGGACSVLSGVIHQPSDKVPATRPLSGLSFVPRHWVDLADSWTFSKVRPTSEDLMIDDFLECALASPVHVCLPAAGTHDPKSLALAGYFRDVACFSSRSHDQHATIQRRVDWLQRIFVHGPSVPTGHGIANQSGPASGPVGSGAGSSARGAVVVRPHSRRKPWGCAPDPRPPSESGEVQLVSPRPGHSVLPDLWSPVKGQTALDGLPAPWQV